MKIRTWQCIVIGMLVLLAMGLVALNAWLTPYDLEKERAAARAAGIPLYPAEFTPPKPPAGGNAAPDWHAFARLMKDHRFDERSLPPTVDEWGGVPPSGEAAVRKVLASRPDLLRAVHRIAGNPMAHFEHTWTVEEIFPHWACARTGSKVLRWESLLMARDGRHLEAVEHQALGLRLANHAADDPIVIAQMVSAAMEDIALAGMADILDMAGPDARVASAVRRAIEANPSRRDLTTAMRSDTMFRAMALRRVRSREDIRYLSLQGDERYTLGSDPSNGLVVHYVARQAEAACLHGMGRYLEAFQRPAPERFAAMDAVTREIQGRSHRRLPPGEELGLFLTPDISQEPRTNTGTLAYRRVLLAACDVMYYRARTGAWPVRLEDVAHLVPMDPYNGKPLGYRREADGFVVFTVGGGSVPATPLHTGSPTLFRYPHPATGSEMAP